jgi:hypothetical protein
MVSVDSNSAWVCCCGNHSTVPTRCFANDNLFLVMNRQIIDTCLIPSKQTSFSWCVGQSHAAVCMPLAEPLPSGQLPSLAAAHIQAYTALIDCQLRTPVLPATSMLLPPARLVHAVKALMGSAAALSNTATVASVASALTSLVKRAVQFIRACRTAGSLRCRSRSCCMLRSLKSNADSSVCRCVSGLDLSLISKWHLQCYYRRQHRQQPSCSERCAAGCGACSQPRADRGCHGGSRARSVLPVTAGRASLLDEVGGSVRPTKHLLRKPGVATDRRAAL